MDSPQDTNQPSAPTPETKPEKATTPVDDQYAEALIKMVNFNYAEQHPDQAKRSEFLSPKQITYLTIIIIVTIVGAVIYNRLNSSSSSNNSTNENTSQTKQILHSVETFNNPNSY
jgi:hypothetical protein